MSTEQLEKRIAKLESQSTLKFFVQYLLSPLLIISVGTFINWQIERNKAEAQRIDLAQKMIPSLFSDKPDQAFATERLMVRVVDPKVAAEIHEMVARYYQTKVASSLKEGNVEAAADIVNAAQSVGGEAAREVVKSVEQNQAQKATIQTYQSKAQVAAQREREGFQKMLDGDIDGAAAAFEAAEAAFNSYHAVYELGRLMRSRKADLSDPVKRKEVFRLIVTQHSYGAPPDLLTRVREIANS